MPAHHLRPATPLTEHTTALRTVSRTRTKLVDARVPATNQLSGLLEGLWPSAKEIFAGLSLAISMAFLHRYPTPQHAATLGEKRMAAFLTKHGYSGRRTPAELLARLRTAPAGTTSPTGPARCRCSDSRPAHRPTSAIKDLDRSAAAHLHEHPDGNTFASFPRAGQVNAAQIRAP